MAKFQLRPIAEWWAKIHVHGSKVKPGAPVKVRIDGKEYPAGAAFTVTNPATIRRLQADPRFRQIGP
jgi:hypothetical protein